VSLNFSKITNENGVALFNLNEQYESGQSGVAIVKIKATYYNKSGESVVQIIEDVTNQCSIQIQ
jgi:peptidyl-tRNA hydrolase